MAKKSNSSLRNTATTVRTTNSEKNKVRYKDDDLETDFIKKRKSKRKDDWRNEAKQYLFN